MSKVGAWFIQGAVKTLGFTGNLNWQCNWFDIFKTKNGIRLFFVFFFKKYFFRNMRYFKVFIIFCQICIAGCERKIWCQSQNKILIISGKFIAAKQNSFRWSIVVSAGPIYTCLMVQLRIFTTSCIFEWLIIYSRYGHIATLWDRRPSIFLCLKISELLT